MTHGDGRGRVGVIVRALRRLLAPTVAIWHDHIVGRPYRAHRASATPAPGIEPLGGAEAGEGGDP